MQQAESVVSGGATYSEVEHPSSDNYTSVDRK